MNNNEERDEEIRKILTLANLLNMRGQMDEALAKCEEALNLDANSVMAHELMGDILASQGKLQEGMEKYKLAFKLDPKNAKIEDKIARLSLRMADEEAMKAPQPAGAVPGAGKRKAWWRIISYVFVGIVMMIFIYMMYAFYVACTRVGR